MGNKTRLVHGQNRVHIRRSQTGQKATTGVGRGVAETRRAIHHAPYGQFELEFP